MLFHRTRQLIVAALLASVSLLLPMLMLHPPLAEAQSPTPQYRIPCKVSRSGNWKAVRDGRGWTDQQLLNDMNTNGKTAHNYPAIDLNNNSNNRGPRTYGICDDLMILSARAGVVIYNNYCPDSTCGAGWSVRIRHDDGQISNYAHMQAKSTLAVNTRYSEGTIIGTMGATGWAEGIHLHFEVVTNPNNLNDRTNNWIFKHPFTQPQYDYNGDGRPELYLIDKVGEGTSSTEVHVLDGANRYQSYLLQTGTPQHMTGINGEWAFGVGDYNSDGKPDLYAIDKVGEGTSSTEVHVLDGANRYQSFLLRTGTPQHMTGINGEWVFGVGDYNSDGKPDLYAIDKVGEGTNSTEVHVLDGANRYQSHLLEIGTSQHMTGINGEWVFGVGDYNGDSKPDLYAIDKVGEGTSSTEVHVLDGANRYQSFLLRIGTPQHMTGINGEWVFGVGDYNNDGIPDLYAIDKMGEGTNSTEVHVLDGANRYQSYLLHTGTPQHMTGINCEWVFAIGQCVQID